MNISNWISLRLKLGGGGSRSASAGVVIAVAGVALALMIMEFTVCIVLGFKHQIRDKISGFESEISIGPRYTDSSGATAATIQLTPQLIRAISEAAPRATASVVLRQPVMLKTADDFCALILTARDDNHGFAFERSMIIDGVWPDYTRDSCANHIGHHSKTAADTDRRKNRGHILYQRQYKIAPIHRGRHLQVGYQRLRRHSSVRRNQRSAPGGRYRLHKRHRHRHQRLACG